MSYFAIDASPSLSQFYSFNSSYSMASIVPSIDNSVGGWNEYSFFEYRSNTFFKYKVVCDAAEGLVRVTYPVSSGFTTDYTTPWFRYGNPSYITLTANAASGYTFVGWREVNESGTLISTFNPWNIDGTQTTVGIIYADFAPASTGTNWYANKYVCGSCAIYDYNVQCYFSGFTPIVGRWYVTDVPDGYAYQIIGSGAPGPGIIMYNQSFNSCGFACFI